MGKNLGCVIFGIDPGVNGGIAKIDGATVSLFSFADHTLSEMVGLFSALFEDDRMLKKVMLERVHAMPSTFRGCSTSWALAEGFSMIKTLLTVYQVPFELVLPEKWQGALGVRVKKSRKKVDKKKINREKAQALFPRLIGITKDTADALLIAEYARRTYR